MCQRCPCNRQTGTSPVPLILIAAAVLIAGSSAALVQVLNDLVVIAAIVTGVLVLGGVTTLVLVLRPRPPVSAVPSRHPGRARQLPADSEPRQLPARPAPAALPAPRTITGRVLSRRASTNDAP